MAATTREGGVKPPFTYFGGKTAIADKIVPLLPPHEHYVEPFAGSLAVLLAKPPSPMETINDLNSDLMTFWRMLRDRPDDLERACELTPHSRMELQMSHEPCDDDLERARRVWVRLTQGRSSHIWRTTGWRDARAHGETNPARLAPVARRLLKVALECMPAVEIIRTYGQNPGCLIYADPPYLGSERNGRGYGCEMLTERDHRDLAEVLTVTSAAVVLSGYPSPLYDELYGSWHRTEIRTQTGQGVGDRSRTEVLWSNRSFPVQDSLFDLFGEAS